MALPKYHVLKKYANGVMDQKGKFFPFQYAAADLSAVETARYYVDKVTVSVIQEGDVAHAHPLLEMTVQRTVQTITMNIALAKVDVIAHSMNQEIDVGMLGDLGTAVDITAAGVACNFNIKYALIYEEMGEYQG